jgi:MmgE/PrpD N-terminal domain
VRCEGVRGLLNFVGCALGGARDEAMDIAVKVLAPFFRAPQAIVIGRGERPDALNAAFLNAISAEKGRCLVDLTCHSHARTEARLNQSCPPQSSI